MVICSISKELKEIVNKNLHKCIIIFLAAEPSLLQWHSSLWHESIFISLMLILFTLILKKSDKVLINLFIGKDITPAIIEEVQKDSPAYTAGLIKNDKIIYIDDNKVESILEVSTYINTSTSEKIEFKILRNQKEISLLIKPKITEGKDAFGNPIKKKIIGIKLSVPGNQLERQRLAPTKAIYYSFKEVWFVITTSLNYIGKIITGSGDSSQLGGPIKIAKITGQVAEHGIIPFLSIMAYISISLGLINLFPIPMLDGGHLMFYLFEKILGKPLSQKTQEGFFRIGLFLLFSLMFFVTFNDLKDLGLF